MEEYLFSRYIYEYFEYLESNLNVEITALGTGPLNNEKIVNKSLILR